MTAAAFRDRIGTGRKLAIIILEFFDRTGVTIRRGDLRKIDPNRRNTFLGQDSDHGSVGPTHARPSRMVV